MSERVSVITPVMEHSIGIVPLTITRTGTVVIRVQSEFAYSHHTYHLFLRYN